MVTLKFHTWARVREDSAVARLSEEYFYSADCDENNMISYYGALRGVEQWRMRSITLIPPLSADSRCNSSRRSLERT